MQDNNQNPDNVVANNDLNTNVPNANFEQANPIIGINQPNVINPTTAPSFFSSNNVIENANANTLQTQNIISTKSKFKINFKFTKKIKTILAIVLASIVIVVAFFVIKNVFFNNNPENMESLERIYSTTNPIAIKKDKKYGFITSEGKELISPEYNGVISNFYGDFAVVYKKSDKATSNQYFVIDKKNAIRASSISEGDIQFMPKYGTWVINNKLYDRNLKQVSSDSKVISTSLTQKNSGLLEFEDKTNKSAGFMDSNGKVIYTYTFSNGESSFTLSSKDIDASIKECYAVVSVDTKDSVINCATGKMVYEFTNNTIINEGNNIFNIVNPKTYKKISYMYISGDKISYQNDESSSDGLDYLYIDKTKKQILKIGYDFTSGHKGKDKYYDVSSKTLLDNKPDGLDDLLSLDELSTGLTTFTCSGGNKGIMMDNKIIIPCEYKYMSFLPIDLFNYIKAKTGKGLVLLENEKTTNLVNVYDKKVIKTFNSTSLNDEADSTFIKASLDDNTGTEVYNLLSNKEMTFKNGIVVSVYSNYIVVSENKTKTYYNTDFKEIYKESL